MHFLKRILNCDDFINLELDESTMPQLTNNQIVDIVKNNEELEGDLEDEIINDNEDKAKLVTTKEAIEALNTLSRYFEQSKSYDDSKMELLENLNDNISEIRDEHKKQKSLFDFFRRE